MKKRTGLLRKIKRSPEHREALRRVKEWTRARFSLPDDAAILVSELACSIPGCPPIETVVAFWTASDRRHHFKVFRPVADVTEDDLPPSWMKEALLYDAMLGCECC